MKIIGKYIQFKVHERVFNQMQLSYEKFVYYEGYFKALKYVLIEAFGTDEFTNESIPDLNIRIFRDLLDGNCTIELHMQEMGLATMFKQFMNTKVMNFKEINKYFKQFRAILNIYKALRELNDIHNIFDLEFIIEEDNPLIIKLHIHFTTEFIYTILNTSTARWQYYYDELVSEIHVHFDPFNENMTFILKDTDGCLIDDGVELHALVDTHAAVIHIYVSLIRDDDDDAYNAEELMPSATNDDEIRQRGQFITEDDSNTEGNYIGELKLNEKFHMKRGKIIINRRKSFSANSRTQTWTGKFGRKINKIDAQPSVQIYSQDEIDNGEEEFDNIQTLRGDEKIDSIELIKSMEINNIKYRQRKKELREISNKASQFPYQLKKKKIHLDRPSDMEMINFNKRMKKRSDIDQKKRMNELWDKRIVSMNELWVKKFQAKIEKLDKQQQRNLDNHQQMIARINKFQEKIEKLDEQQLAHVIEKLEEQRGAHVIDINKIVAKAEAEDTLGKYSDSESDSDGDSNDKEANKEDSDSDSESDSDSDSNGKEANKEVDEEADSDSDSDSVSKYFKQIRAILNNKEANEEVDGKAADKEGDKEDDSDNGQSSSSSSCRSCTYEGCPISIPYEQTQSHRNKTELDIIIKTIVLENPNHSITDEYAKSIIHKFSNIIIYLPIMYNACTKAVNEIIIGMIKHAENLTEDWYSFICDLYKSGYEGQNKKPEFKVSTDRYKYINAVYYEIWDIIRIEQEYRVQVLNKLNEEGITFSYSDGITYDRHHPALKHFSQYMVMMLYVEMKNLFVKMVPQSFIMIERLSNEFDFKIANIYEQKSKDFTFCEVPGSIREASKCFSCFESVSKSTPQIRQGNRFDIKTKAQRCEIVCG